MEEIVTVDGKQFKLTTDRPLTAQEKAQAMTEIRKQTGCGTCGSKAPVRTMDPNWKYGGIRTLAPTCPAPGVKGASDNPKLSGEDITLSINPSGGVGPYDITFLKTPYTSTSTDGADAVIIDTTRLGTIAGGTGASNPVLDVAEGTATTRYYRLDDADISGARVRGADTVSSIIFRSDVIDSCQPAGATCSEICKIFTGCVAPTCNFVVS